MKLSYQRALWAAYTLLDQLEDIYKLDFFLSDINPFIYVGWICCADPAYWTIWTDCCKSVDDSGFLTFEQVMTVLVNFLKVNEEEFSCFAEYGGDYSADDVIRGISTYVKNGRWNEILNNVYNYKEPEPK